jgi:nucleotide-binding universal stress UspA family protein/CBS domain-containing protein
MTIFKRILCPVDLAKPNLSAIDLATYLAKGHGGTVVFIYVAPQWVTDRTIVETNYVKGAIEADRQALHEILPTDPAVPSEHLFVFGNPGPEIVKVSSQADVIVMNTHGYAGLKRFLMGSVAEYVTRYAECAVISYKCPPDKVQPFAATPSNAGFKPRFVTEIMHHVAPIRANEKMEAVVTELRAAKATAAPVVNSDGHCIGILTDSDLVRFEAGHNRTATVEHFCSSPVVTILESQVCDDAEALLRQNPNIHHLIVVTPQQVPLGVLTSKHFGLPA